MDSTSQGKTAPAAATASTQNDIASNSAEARAPGSNRGRNRSRRGGGTLAREVALVREAGGAQETNRGETSNLDGVISGNAATSEAKRGGNSRRGRGRGRGGAVASESAGARTPTDSIATTSSLPDRPPPVTDSRPPRKQQPKANGTVPAPSRRNRFNAALSTSNPLSASSTPFPPPASSATAIPGPIVAPANQTLLERLTTELTQGTYDCSICFSTLSKSTAIHSCTTCHTAFHLNCIEKWATRSCVESAERAAILASRNSGNRVGPAGEGGVWRCPACQSPSPSTAIPKTYTCFCTRVVNPQLRLPITPHSCGGQCARARPAGCKHACALSCHPGPCPACPVVLQEDCHCGKKILAVRCSAINSLKVGEGLGREELMSCREGCGKMLGCGLHRCAKECHSGDCAPCEDVREKRCYCGKDQLVEMCGEGARERIECYRPSVEGDKSSWEGEFSCDRVCDAPFDCSSHKCKLSCHPHSTSTPSICPFSPTVLTHCPCTTTPLTRLLSTPRTSCLAPIPTCDSLCPKLLPCGHACDKPCHPGACESCTRSIATVCRCGSLKGNRQCGLVESSSEILCEKVCRAMRNCGRHECGRKCCPLSFQEALKARGGGNKSRNRRAVDLLEGVDVFSRENDPEGLHTCERICGRKLGCGIHLCAERDHKGPCGTCLLANFDELICHCGSTIMLPPIACNTTIDCRHPCIRPSTCGHPPMPHACHENENCPPCPFLMTKSCQCGKKGVGNVRCSSKNVSCGTACGKLLRCGFHRCKSTCHPPTDACDTCSQVCLKPLRICSHPCPLDCHAPSTCPTDIPCTFSIEVTCACGNLKQKAKCGSCDAKEEGNRERMIKCSESCVIKKRNDALAEALGIEARERKVREVEYDPMTLSYYSDHPTWCTALETTLTEFINGDKNGLNLPVAKRVARKFTHELAEAFELRSEGVDEEPYRSIMITRQSTSSIPTPTLAEACATRKSSSSSLLTFGSLRKIPEKANHHNAILFERVGGYEEIGLRELVRGSLRGVGSFTVEWISSTDVLLHPTFSTPLTSTSISSLLTPLSHLMDQTGFCSSLEGVYSPLEGGEIKRGGAWTTTGSGNASGAASGSATPEGAAAGWRNGGARGWGTNLFEALNQTPSTSGTAEAGSKSKLPKIAPTSIPSTSTSTSIITETGVASTVRSESKEGKDDAAGKVERELDIPDDWEEVDAVVTPVKVDTSVKLDGTVVEVDFAVEVVATVEETSSI